MEAAVVARRPRVLAEIDPHSEWVPGADFNTLVVDVTGFSKDELKVLVEPDGRLTVTGERAVDGGDAGRQQRLHFTKRFGLPAGSERGDGAAIRVHLDKGMLYVQVPRRPGVADPDGEPGERYDDALQPRWEGETGDGGGGGGYWMDRVTARREEQQHPVRRLAGALSRHRQVVLNAIIAVVLLWALSRHRQVVLSVMIAVVVLWLVAFANKAGGGGRTRND